MLAPMDIPGHPRTQGENPRWIGQQHISGPVRRQYLALVEAVGLPNAPHYMERFIEWPSDHRPPEHVLRDWRQTALEEGYEADERLIRRFRQQIRAYNEFQAWRTVEQMTKTSRVLSEKAEAGELEAAKQVQLQYSGMNLAYTLKEVSAAFGTPKPTQTQIGKFTLNMGEPPKRKLRSAPPALREVTDIIDAEVRELGSKRVEE